MPATGRHPYGPIPRDLSRSWSHLTSQYWWRAVENAQHLADTRGRCIACDRYILEPIPAVAAEIARYYYQPTDEEESLSVQLLFAMLPAPGMAAEVTISWYVTTATTAGANLATSATQADRIVLPGDADTPLGRTIPLAWPLEPHERLAEVGSSAIVHDHAAALPSAPRVLRVYASVAGLSITIPSVWLRGVYAHGFRGGL